jgi:saccharopine dehydrogenase-like NADP-dependent oxidoreductase
VAERIAKRSFTLWENGKWIQQTEKNQTKTLYYLVSGNFGDLYFPEEQKILPTDLPEEIKNWINSHKKNLR